MNRFDYFESYAANKNSGGIVPVKKKEPNVRDIGSDIVSNGIETSESKAKAENDRIKAEAQSNVDDVLLSDSKPRNKPVIRSCNNGSGDNIKPVSTDETSDDEGINDNTSDDNVSNVGSSVDINVDNDAGDNAGDIESNVDNDVDVDSVENVDDDTSNGQSTDVPMSNRYIDSVVTGFADTLANGFDESAAVKVLPDDLNVNDASDEEDIGEDDDMDLSEHESSSGDDALNDDDDDDVISDIPVSTPVVAKSRVRGVNKNLIDRARKLFPDASSIDECIEAYIYHFEGCPSDLGVEDRIAKIEKNYQGDDVSIRNLRHDVLSELDLVRGDLKRLTAKMEAVELAMVYIICDRIGSLKKSVNTDGTVDFLEFSVIDLLKHLERQSGLKQQKDASKKGKIKR